MSRVAVLLAAASDVPGGEGWLDPREAAVLAGLRVPKRREEWLLGRWTAKRAVSLFLGDDVARAPVCILAAPDGAPEAWTGAARAPCVISISHRAGRSCCAIAGPATELGCDLELVEPRSDGFLADYLTEAEVDAVTGAPSPERDLRANLLWSTKESVLKARRTGLREDSRSVRVLPTGDTPADGAWSRLEAEDALGDRWACWWAVRDGFVLTIAARPPSDEPVELYPDPTTSSTSSP